MNTGPGVSTTLCADVVAVLTAMTPSGGDQHRLRSAYLRHLADHPDALWRDGPPAHLTASCFVLDPGGTQVLLTLHRKGRFWVQFGGHLEFGDTSLAGAALRETIEESGLAEVELLPRPRPLPVGLHRHDLSAAFGRCREHLDVTYLAIAPAGAQPRVSAESDDVAWWPVDQLPPAAVPDLAARVAQARDAVRLTGRRPG